MSNIRRALDKWVGRNPVRAAIVQLLCVLVVFVVTSLVTDSATFFASPWMLLRKLILFNLPVCLGVGFYVWWRTRESKLEKSE